MSMLQQTFQKTHLSRIISLLPSDGSEMKGVELIKLFGGSLPVGPVAEAERLGLVTIRQPGRPSTCLGFYGGATFYALTRNGMDLQEELAS
jgi:hypothetical protein